jgi:hypothetical protein
VAERESGLSKGERRVSSGHGQNRLHNSSCWTDVSWISIGGGWKKLTQQSEVGEVGESGFSRRKLEFVKLPKV